MLDFGAVPDPPPDRPAPDLRASDADRERAVMTLGRAAGEGRPRVRVVASGAGATSWIVSIMGGNERTGRWRLAERCNVLNFMGGSELDLNDAELSSDAIDINVFTLMGGFEIRVPNGVDKRGALEQDDSPELER